MKCCSGVWRKIVFLPLSTLALGWIVYLVGFCLTITSQEAANSSRFDYIAHYISVAAPLPVVLLASLHTALFGRPSLIFGFFASLLSVICFPALGHTLFSNAAILYDYGHDISSDRVDMKSVISSAVSLVGCLLMSLSWTAVTVLWNTFTHKNVKEADLEGTAVASSFMTDIVCYAGVARKLAAVFLFLQLICWCRFVAGMESQVNIIIVSFYKNVPEVLFDFDVWMVFTTGVLIIICALIHTAVRGESISEVGAFTRLLSMPYLTCVGHLIFSFAIAIYRQCEDRDISIWDYPRYQLYQLSSGIGTCIFWGVVLGLQPLYFASAPPNTRSTSPSDIKVIELQKI